MGKALYRQYRSTSFDEVIGQEHITTTLKNSLKNGSIGHAYLLTGPRGVGKTSVARILAFAVNGLPYENDSIHLDIIEIDAASNRRIDEIRSLRERVHIAPTTGKYKVYIIDEVHMLTREAFNALLKTLEEPPAHVIFILATTEIHKLPDTIISRCITFTFRPIDQANIVAHLKHISKAEGFKISDDALQLLAMHGEGSFRDSISLLDQIKSASKSTEATDIELALGLASQVTIDSILKAVSQGNPQALATDLQHAYDHGSNEANLSKQIAARVRNGLLTKKSDFSSDDALRLLAELLSVPASPKPRNKLELCLLEQLFKQHRVDAPKPAAIEAELSESAEVVASLSVETIVEPIEKKVSKSNEDVISLKIDEIKVQTDENKNQPAKPSTPRKATTAEIDTEVWDAVLQKLKIQNNTLYGIARMAEAELADKKLLLCFRFPFHFRQVSQPKNRSIIIGIVEGLGHKNLEVVITQKTDGQKPVKSFVQDSSLANITNIFGDHEVLES
ncbi:MAG: DNA polymerase III subunit gamma/tau [Candidatus Saccharimonadales bacterium]